MNIQKKDYVAPKYTVIKFDAHSILTSESGDCYEVHGYESGTDCHDQEMYLPQS